MVKPDLVAFGGSLREPFMALDGDGTLALICGTSFAGPSVMRAALGVRALFGGRLTPLALRALALHVAEPDHSEFFESCGRGRLPSDLDSIVTCPGYEARVVYQGELRPGKYLRAQLPLPTGPLPGMVEIRATLVFATEVDTQDPGNYTRSGVEIHFRPDMTRYATPQSSMPQTRPFFVASSHESEVSRRNDGHKWETGLHRRKRFQGKSLESSVFDIHYVAREEGHATTSAEKIRYAMVISVIAPRVFDLYDRVLRAFVTQLEPLTPVLELPLRT